MKYVCNYCGKTSDDIDVIRECEAKHEELKKKKEEAKAKRDTLYSEYKEDVKKVNDLVKEINDKYSACDFPKLGIYETSYRTSYLNDVWSDFLGGFLR